MPLTKRVHGEGYTYVEAISAISQDAIDETKAQFENYKIKGIIIDGKYDDPMWRVTNEVEKSLPIDFSLNELEYRRFAAKKLGCAYSDYQAAMRVYAIYRLRYALTTVMSDLRVISRFAVELELPAEPEKWCIIRDFLNLLPGWSDFRDKIIDTSYNFLPFSARQSQPRILQSYRSYFRFDHYLSKFWAEASPEEKTLYFPLWMWWHVTMVIPLRATEFVLTPRNCIGEDQGHYFIKLRRTRLKSQNGTAVHTIAGDYELCRYEIPKLLFDEIYRYLSATADSYDSDIDTLFCKSTQFEYSRIVIKSDRHYTYSNLFQLLERFYSHVLQGRYGLEVIQTADDETLPDNAIGTITLGDTRHIANINLMVSGQSATLCKELSRHSNIDISSNYYSSVRSFLDALSFDFVPVNVSDSGNALMCLSKSDSFSLQVGSELISVNGGKCASAQVASGDFSPCTDAIGPYGEIGYCDCCPYFCGGPQARKNPSVALEESCELFVQALNAIRSHDNQHPLESIIAQLQARSQNYLYTTAIERRYKEMTANDKNK